MEDKYKKLWVDLKQELIEVVDEGLDLGFEHLCNNEYDLGAYNAYRIILDTIETKESGVGGGL